MIGAKSSAKILKTISIPKLKLSVNNHQAKMRSHSKICTLKVSTKRNLIVKFLILQYLKLVPIEISTPNSLCYFMTKANMKIYKSLKN